MIRTLPESANDLIDGGPYTASTCPPITAVIEGPPPL
jgi:hypothetical protein